MKSCPICDRNYGDDVTLCDMDGATLRLVGKKLDLYIGKVIKGRYNVISKLGEGGMGTVYLAEQLNIGRKVALKLLQGVYAGDDEFIGRFRREARLAASLSHRNIVTVYDFDQGDDGTLFIAMEYLRGTKLSDVIRADGPLKIERAVLLGLQLAEGLDAAHRAGVIHRDIKPDNVMVVGGPGAEEVKLMDFGIARMMDTATMSPLTRPGVIMGTPAYMAPEQAEGTSVSEQTDIYALGIVLYEMFTGSVPFQASTPGAVLIKQIQEAPRPLRKLRREVPAAVERVVMQALEKKPQKRQHSMRDVAQTLRQIEVTSHEQPTKTLMETLRLRTQISDRMPAVKNKRIWLGGVAAGLVLLLVVFLLLRWGFTRSEQNEVNTPPSRKSIENFVQSAARLADQGDYTAALAELNKAKSISPVDKSVSDAIERTKSACLAEKRIGLTTLSCE